MSGWHEIINKASWLPRRKHAVVSRRDVMTMFGGFNSEGNNSDTLNDIWSSRDGKSWSLVTARAPWTGRDGHCVVVMDDCFYLIGGTQDAYLCFNDVWRSNDAVHWRSLSDDCMWQARWQHTCVVHANCLFILGGWGDGHLNDVWKSSDCGNSWKCICPSAPWMMMVT